MLACESETGLRVSRLPNAFRAAARMTMSNVEELAQETLKTAQADVARARRNLWLAVAVLALLHLLTVQPYLETQRHVAELGPRIADNAAMLVQLEGASAMIERAGAKAEQELRSSLDGATETMVDDFARLRGLVARAEQGDVPLAWQDGTGGSAQIQMQQMAPEPMNMPNLSAGAASAAISPNLQSVLEAIAGREPNAYAQLVDYARHDIVEAAYGDVQQRWARSVRPAYLREIDSLLAQVREASARSESLAEDTTTELRNAADELQARRDSLAALEIRPDAEVDDALGTEWWRTVQGKGAFADAVAESIDGQMREISTAAAAPAATLERILDLQQKLQAELTERQKELERQFAEAQQNLATLSGAGGVLPVDLVASIGLFPLLIGLSLAALVLRGAQARRQAALAAEELAATAPSGSQMRWWLVRQALGGGGATMAMLTTLSIGLAVVAWIILAAVQVADSPLIPPLPPWRAAGIAVIAIVAALAWDGAMIRRLQAAAA